jgi:hypothetical protein
MDPLRKMISGTKKFFPYIAVAVSAVPLWMFFFRSRSEYENGYDDVIGRLEAEMRVNSTGKEWQKSGMIPK